MSLAPAPPVLEDRAIYDGPAALSARYWHLLSLDAPSVAALWAWALARTSNISLPWSAPLALALGTWLLYITDRMLDGAGNRRSASSLRERHYFYLRHRGRFFASGVCGALLLLWLIATRMSPAALHENLALFALALVYFGVIHLGGCRVERWFPKELAVGLIFSSATAVPAWSRLVAHRLQLLPIILLFSALCWINCVAIEKWETPRPAASDQSPDKHRSTGWLERRLQPVAAVVALIAIAACAVRRNAAPQSSALFLACALSALLLLGLDRGNLPASRLRIAADAALLTPLVLLLAG